jgi:carboxyl-terminal processing protease
MFNRLIFGFSLIFIGNNLQVIAQDSNKQCNYIQVVLENITELHYQPKPLNSEWSNNIWKTFINDIDPQGFYFTQSEVDSLLRYSDSISTFIQDNNCNFFEEIKNLYKQKLMGSDALISGCLDRPFTFKITDSLTIYKNGNIKYPKNIQAARLRWQTWLKYKTLINIFTVHRGLLDSIPITQLIQEKEKEARIAVIKKHRHQLTSILNRPEGFDKYFLNRFLNILATSFDPHTSFFSYSDKKNFESDISTETYTFGFDFEENQNGEIEITHLIPGGPAWKSNEINKGDIMVSYKLPNMQAEDLSFSDEYDVEEIFNLPTTKNIDLTVRKLNGQVKTITLLKEKLSAEENLIKSVLLDGQRKIGYISLPGFYAEWTRQDNGCTNDMARELIKLKKDKIEGLIIDLRFNGGGSMQEAISLAGIFINEGPVCLVNDKTGKPYVLKDDIRGTVYDGPLILLVNGFSASSAEILTSTLQDYHRAIIVGSPTYGKSSSQIIYPIDTTTQNARLMAPDEGNQEFIKVTTNKLYRITGSTFQKTGITPDIPLPGNLEFGYRESESENALSNDKIDKTVRYFPLRPYPVKELADMSSERIKNNANFQNIILLNDSLKSFLQSTNTICLDPQSFRNSEFRHYEMLQKLDSLLTQDTDLYTANNSDFDKQVIDMNLYKKEMNKLIQAKAQKDIYIQESYQILLDLINFKNKLK